MPSFTTLWIGVWLGEFLVIASKALISLRKHAIWYRYAPVAY